MKKSFLSLLFVIVLAFSLVAGCVNNSTSTSSQNNSQISESSSQESVSSLTPSSSQEISSENSSQESISSTTHSSSSQEISSAESSSSSQEISSSSSVKPSSSSQKPSSSSSTIVSYTITFVNGQQTMQQSSIQQGANVVYNGVSPSKEADAQYTYTFAGWSKTQDGSVVDLSTEVVTGTQTYYAVFTKTLNSYTVTWNVEGTTTTTSVQYGKAPTNSTNPSKNPNAEYTYTFVGWSKTQNGEVVTLASEVITGTQTYYAVFKATKNSYTITWDVEGLTTTTTVEYGKAPTNSSTPIKSADSNYTYSFAGWSKTKNGDIVNLTKEIVTGKQTYYAVFTATEVPKTNVVKNGSFDISGTTFTSTSANSLLIRNTDTFTSGTLSAKVTLGALGSDNGIIFRVTNPNNLSSYWEQSVSYYFFFLSRDNLAYLGKVNNGAWQVCQTAPFTVVANTTYTLSVSIDTSNNAIRCYINGALYVGFKDSTLLSGLDYGVRAGASNVVFNELSKSTTILGKSMTASDYYMANGGFTASSNGLTATTGNSIAVKQNEQFKFGTLEATMKLDGSNTDNGIIFGLSTDSTSFWERAGTSYYFFFIASSSGHIMIAKTDNGAWTHFANKPISSFNKSGTYTLKVERNSQLVYLYVNNTLYLTLGDTSLQGTGFGLRTGGGSVSFTSLVNLSGYENILPPAPSNFTAKVGGVYGQNNSFVASANTIALYNTALNKGTFSVNIAANTNQETGVVFNYKDNNNYYRFYTQRTSQTVKIAKKVNGQETILYSNYLSAGYSEFGVFTFSVILTNNKAYCHFFNTRYAIIDCDTSTSSSVGIFAQGNSALFTDFTVSTSQDVLTVDTLLFGHSYFELWSNWKNDLSGLNLGTYTNIGIGGSIASHWYNFKDSIVSFKPTQVIYMIGINDLTAGVSPENTASSVRDLLLYLKEEIPSLNVILLGVNQCPARYTGSSYNRAAEVTRTNELYRQLVLDYDSWINFVELENAFSDSNLVPLNSWFTDGLHPTAKGYTDIIVPGITAALNGQNQPTQDASQTAKLLAEAKQIKIDSLSSYSSQGFRASEWTTAKPIYENAINAINACTTRAQVLSLDLSTYISQLDAIKHNGDYSFTETVNQTYTNNGSNYSASLWETTLLTSNIEKSTNGQFLIGGDGHRLNDKVTYASDLDFKFKVSNNTGHTDVLGVMFLANQNDNLGIDGYVINIVTEPNYIQIWYFKNAWGLDINANGILEYIGGWVFPGEVENTMFRAIVKDGFINVYTEDAYQNGGANAYGCRVDLTGGSRFPLYNCGHIGFISWNNNINTPNFTTDLYIGDICGSTVAGLGNAQTVNTNILSNTNCQNYFGQNYTDAGNGMINCLGFSYTVYNGLQATDFTMVVDSEKLTTGVGLAGFLFHTKKNATYNGIDGYILNYVANATEQYIQILRLDNYYSTDGSSGSFKYMGGWVFSNTSNNPICGQDLVVKVVGNQITVSTLNASISFGLQGDQIGANDAVYTSGGFGYVSWQDNFNIDLIIKSITI